MRKIIIAQKHQSVIDELKALIGEKNNVVFTTNTGSALAAVPTNEPYVLLTGMVFDGITDGVSLSTAAKRKNKNGKVVLLTTMIKHEEMFDGVIDKYEQPRDVWHKQVNDLVKN